MSTKVWEHTAQNYVAQRFQKYVDNWSDTNQSAEEYDLTNISSMPVSLFVAEADQECTAATAERTLEDVATIQNFVTLTGKSHEYFVNASD